MGLPSNDFKGQCIVPSQLLQQIKLDTNSPCAFLSFFWCVEPFVRIHSKAEQILSALNCVPRGLSDTGPMVESTGQTDGKRYSKCEVEYKIRHLCSLSGLLAVKDILLINVFFYCNFLSISL